MAECDSHLEPGYNSPSPCLSKSSDPKRLGGKNGTPFSSARTNISWMTRPHPGWEKQVPPHFSEEEKKGLGCALLLIATINYYY